MSRSFDRYWNDPRPIPWKRWCHAPQLDALRAPATAAAQGPTATPPPTPVPANPGSVMPDVTASLQINEGFDLRRVPLVWAPATLLVDQPARSARTTMKPMPAKPWSTACWA